MRIIAPEVIRECFSPAHEEPEKFIEHCGRLCYQSTHKITGSSHGPFCRMLVRRGHLSVLEHCTASFRFITSRGVTHELVRHRLASYSQESTRFCNYKGGVAFCCPSRFLEPFGMDEDPVEPHFSQHEFTSFKQFIERYPHPVEQWLVNMLHCEHGYFEAIENDWKPQEARGLLPIDLKTEIVTTANLRQWLLMTHQRTSPAAHPDIRYLFQKVKASLAECWPNVIDEYFKQSTT